MEDKPVAYVRDGNIFAVMGAARKSLRRAGMRKEAEELLSRVTASHSYDEALAIISEYVDLELEG